MKLATLKDGGRDGRLVVVSRDLRRAVDAGHVAPTLIDALQRWDLVAAPLTALYETLQDGRATQVFDFDPAACAAPLPRAPQWCDGSAFLNHGRLMEKAFGIAPAPGSEETPLMYQGGSDDLLGPHDDLPLPSEEHGIDFEGEFAVVVADVPMGCPAAMARNFIRLLVQVNDVSLC